MTQSEIVFGFTAVALICTTIAGLLLRRRWNRWYAYTFYLVVMAGSTLVFAFRPDWHLPGPYMLQQNVINALRLCMALELAVRTFRAFPGARSTLRGTLLVVVLAVFTLVVGVPTSSNNYESFLAELQPRVINGTIWVFTAIGALILWYRLPIGPLHKSILLSYVPILLFDTVFLKSIAPKTWEDEPVVRLLNPIVYTALLLHWNWVAWRVEEPAQAPPRPFESGVLVLGGGH